MSVKTSVKIHGKTYFLKSGQNKFDPEELAIYLDQKMDDISKTKTAHSTTDLAVLTALNVAGELKEVEEKYRSETKRIKKRLELLIKTVGDELKNIE